ncbi:hypothetical protein DPX16_4100 [Anabarilius grahami]|uniref:Uncharacterized protein n=2 Tax=Xenocypridinae TaxID=2743747 RepID=A0A3N0XYC8_ANAGA|nr:hypothetical protein DPX16_4100 [Anabarilius grahami]
MFICRPTQSSVGYVVALHLDFDLIERLRPKERIRRSFDDAALWTALPRKRLIELGAAVFAVSASSQERRGEESARRRESEEKKRASLDPLAGNFLSALGRGKQVGKSVHLFLTHLLAWTFFCFSPLNGGEFWGREGIWRGRMVNNLIECEEAEGAANSQGEWRNLSRSHTPTHAATGMVSADGGRVRAAGSAVAAHDRSTPVHKMPYKPKARIRSRSLDVPLSVVLNPARQHHYQSALPSVVQGPDLSLSLQAEADYQEI